MYILHWGWKKKCYNITKKCNLIRRMDLIFMGILSKFNKLNNILVIRG